MLWSCRLALRMQRSSFEAYRRWDQGCPNHLLGDFAFALWDAPRRLLFCARDVMGLRPFYYWVDQHRFVAGSELRQVLLGLPREATLNEGMIGECLSGVIVDKEETLYTDVRRLAPGHVLVVRPDRRDMRSVLGVFTHRPPELST